MDLSMRPLRIGGTFAPPGWSLVSCHLSPDCIQRAMVGLQNFVMLIELFLFNGYLVQVKVHPVPGIVQVPAVEPAQ